MTLDIITAAAKPRCRCDSVGVDLCPAGCAGQTDRMALAELRRRAEGRSRPQQRLTTVWIGGEHVDQEPEQLELPIQAAVRVLRQRARWSR